jgi:hypothetical protein
MARRSWASGYSYGTAVNENSPVRRVEQPRDQTYKCRFAAASFADESDRLSGFDNQINIAKDRFAVVTKIQGSKFYTAFNARLLLDIFRILIDGSASRMALNLLSDAVPR